MWAPARACSMHSLSSQSGSAGKMTMSTSPFVRLSTPFSKARRPWDSGSSRVRAAPTFSFQSAAPAVSSPPRGRPPTVRNLHYPLNAETTSRKKIVATHHMICIIHISGPCATSPPVGRSARSSSRMLLTVPASIA